MPARRAWLDVQGTFTKCGSSVTYRSLADGDYTFRVRAVHGDLVDGTPDTQAFTVDTVAPAAPTITAPPDNSAQNSTTVTLSGTAEAGATVEVFEGATSRGTTTANRRHLDALDPRRRRGLAHIHGDGARRGRQRLRKLQRAHDHRRRDRARRSGHRRQQPHAEHEHGHALRQRRTRRDGRRLRRRDHARHGERAERRLDGDDQLGRRREPFLVATARDAAGNSSGNSNTRTITVDTTAPAAPVIGGSNGAQNTSTVTLTGTAEANAVVEVVEGATSRGTAVATGGNWTVTINSVADGAHSYVAKATDAAGNVSGSSNTRTITVDTVAPNAPVIGGSNATQNTSTVTLSGTAEAGATVTVLEGATTRGTATATGGNWTVTINSVADGAHSYVATARDAAGNTSGNSNTRTITVDTTAPNAPVIGGANGIQKSTTVTLSGTAETNATVEVFEGATSRGSATATGGNWTVTINTVADGAHSYVARATDAASNTSGDSNTRTITVDTIAPNAPVIGGSNAPQNKNTVTLSGTAEAGATVTVLEGATNRGSTTATGGNWTVTINSVADGAHAYIARATDAATNTSGNSNTRTITVDTVAPNAPVIGGSNATQGSATVTLSGTAEADATVEVFEGANSRGTTTATGGNWTLAINNVPDGAHSYIARATDAATNTSGNSNTRTITVDSAIPDTTITSDPHDPTKSNSPSFSFTSTKANSTFRCKLDGPGAATGTFAACTSPKAYAGLADGDYTFSVVATDPLNHEDPTPATEDFTVDTAAPAATIDAGPAGPIRTDPTFAFHSPDDGATLECRMNRQGAPRTTSTSAPRRSRTVTRRDRGHYTFEVRATDDAGNTGPIGRARSRST